MNTTTGYLPYTSKFSSALFYQKVKLTNRDIGEASIDYDGTNTSPEQVFTEIEFNSVDELKGILEDYKIFEIL